MISPDRSNLRSTRVMCGRRLPSCSTSGLQPDGAGGSRSPSPLPPVGAGLGCAFRGRMKLTSAFLTLGGRPDRQLDSPVSVSLRPDLSGASHERFLPRCMCRLLFAIENLARFRKSLICIRLVDLLAGHGLDGVIVGRCYPLWASMNAVREIPESLRLNFHPLARSI